MGVPNERRLPLLRTQRNLPFCALLRSKFKIFLNLFGSLFAYLYLCNVKMYVLTTPLSAGSKT
jgi:hypothetical protein